MGEGGDAKDGKGKKDDKKGGKDKKDKKSKDKGGDDDAPAMPKLQGKTETTNGMDAMVNEYEGTWESKDESDNFQQKHDVELSKQVVRPNVYEDIRKQVDEMLIMNLKKIQLQIAPTGKKGKKSKK